NTENIKVRPLTISIVKNQAEFIEYVKKTINKAIKRENSGIKGSFPFDDLFVHPKNPTTLFPLVERFYMRPVFVWVPEFFWPWAFPSGYPPCPTCQKTEYIRSKCWNTESRRVVMADRCCDLICYRYACLNCKSHKKLSHDPEVKQISYTFNAWD